MANMKRVIAIFPGNKRALGGCEIYRTTMPYHYLSEKFPEWKTAWAFYSELKQQAEVIGPAYWSLLAEDYDIFVFPRVYFFNNDARSEFEMLVEELHKRGKKVVYELDDDMTNKHRHVVDGDAVACAKECDAITVTTKYLGKLMEEETSRRSYVLPNMFAPELWYQLHTGTFRLQDKIVIGLTGSPTHKDDWRVLEHVLPKILADDKVHLLLMGYHPDYLKDLPNTTLLPGVLYEKYAQVIQSCDIIIGSVNGDLFNLGKSSIKIVEGMAARRMVDGLPAGAACIASDHPIYNQTIKHNKTGLLVSHTQEGWQEGLDRLVYNEKLRKELQFNGHEWVDKHHNIAKTVHLWQNAYNSVLRK